MHCVGISKYQFIPYYASALHKHTRFLTPFEDSELTGLKMDLTTFRHELRSQDMVHCIVWNSHAGAVRDEVVWVTIVWVTISTPYNPSSSSGVA